MIFDQTIQAMQEVLKMGNSAVMADGLFLKVKQDSKEPVSHYQVYAVLKYLLDRECISRKNWREGYLLEESFQSRAEQAWKWDAAKNELNNKIKLLGEESNEEMHPS